MQRGSVAPQEALKIVAAEAFLVSNSLSLSNTGLIRQNHFNPFRTLVLTNQAWGAVK